MTIAHRRDQLRAQKVLQDRAFANDKIHFAWNTVVEEIKGEQKVTSVLLKDVKTGEVREQAFGGVFIYVGLDPVSDFATELGILDENGWVITDDHMRTTVPGIFCGWRCSSKRSTSSDDSRRRRCDCWPRSL